MSTPFNTSVPEYKDRGRPGNKDPLSGYMGYDHNRPRYIDHDHQCRYKTTCEDQERKVNELQKAYDTLLKVHQAYDTLLKVHQAGAIKLEDNKKKLTEKETEVESLKEKNKNLRKDVVNLESESTELQHFIDKLWDEKITVEVKFDDLQAKFDDLQCEIEDLNKNKTLLTEAEEMPNDIIHIQHETTDTSIQD